MYMWKFLWRDNRILVLSCCLPYLVKLTLSMLTAVNMICVGRLVTSISYYWDPIKRFITASGIRQGNYSFARRCTEQRGIFLHGMSGWLHGHPQPRPNVIEPMWVYCSWLWGCHFRLPPAAPLHWLHWVGFSCLHCFKQITDWLLPSLLPRLKPAELLLLRLILAHTVFTELPFASHMKSKTELFCPS